MRTSIPDPDNHASNMTPTDVEHVHRRKNTRLIPTTLLACLMAVAISACGGGGGGGSGGTGTGDPGGGYGDGTGDTTDDTGDTTDDTGDTTDDTDDTGDDDDTVEATLASIQENVFTPICTACHTGASAPQGLRLEEGMSYGMLVNVASTEVPSLLRVDPGNPDDSYLIQKLEGTAAVGDRMPLGGPYLSQSTIDAIRQWITDGAADTASAPSPAMTKTSLTAAWPVADSVLNEAPAAITVIADGELDASQLHSGSVQIVQLDRIDPVSLEARAVRNVDLQLSSLSPTVLNLRAAASEWVPGIYEVRIKGSGIMAVSDRAGRTIDGDNNGEPGGDFVFYFRIGQ